MVMTECDLDMLIAELIREADKEQKDRLEIAAMVDTYGLTGKQILRRLLVSHGYSDTEDVPPILLPTVKRWLKTRLT